ncbi:MAG: helix-turn-helix domain-containing protein [Faecalibacterium sp.]
MKKGSYLTIQDWMITDLHLKGNELLAYALIYGFSQDDQSCFYGSYQYVMEWLSIDKTTAVRVLKKLEEKGLIRKWQEPFNGVMTNRYAVITEPDCHATNDQWQNTTGGKMQLRPVAKCNPDRLQNATQIGCKMQPKNTKEKSSNNKTRARGRGEDTTDTPDVVFVEFAKGNSALLEGLREFDEYRRSLASRDKKKPWTALAARKICKSLERLTREAAVRNRIGYMIAMLDQSIENGWTGVFAAKDFIDRSPAEVHTMPEPDKPRLITRDMTLADLLGGAGS